MTCRCKKAREAAAKAADEVLEHGSHAFEDVVDYLTPRARHAAERVAPVLEQARERLTPAFEEARERLTPVFEDTRDAIIPRMSEMADKVSPTVQHAYETVVDKVEHDVYPRLHGLWEQASESPAVVEASLRGRSAAAALRGELALPEPAPVEVPKESRILRKVLAAIGLAALIGAIVLAVRAVLGSKDDGWSPVQPMGVDVDDEAEWGDSPFGDEVAGEPDVDTTATATDDEAEELMVAEGGPAAAATPDDNKPEQAAAPGYGDGAYVGSEPPEGFAIKGNERSMKYHVPEAAGYDRTNADVWFNSEEAAQAAGFTRALR